MYLQNRNNTLSCSFEKKLFSYHKNYCAIVQPYGAQDSCEAYINEPYNNLRTFLTG